MKSEQEKNHYATESLHIESKLSEKKKNGIIDEEAKS